MMDRIRYEIHVYRNPAEDGPGFTAIVPELLGCRADGETEKEAWENAASAIVEWLDEAKRLGRAIPEPRYNGA